MPNATVENASVHEGELIGNMITFGLTLFLILGILCISTHFLRTVSQILDKKLHWYGDALKWTREILR